MPRGYRTKSRGDPAGYVRRTYECPDCQGRFEVFERRAEHPSFCLKCGACFDEEQAAVPGTHAIGGSVQARAVDFTYDQMVAAGNARAELAGNPNLKINNMSDSVREGDVAIKGPQPSPYFQQFQAAASSKNINYGFLSGGGQRVGGMMPGPNGPNSFVGPGHIAMHEFQQMHERNFAAVKAGGLRAKGS